jgi:hypothetical protein
MEGELGGGGGGSGTCGQREWKRQIGQVAFVLVKMAVLCLCTDKKENQIFLIYNEIQSGAVAKSYMTNGLIIYGEIFPNI